MPHQECKHDGPRDCAYTDTVAYRARWGEEFEAFFGDSRVIWECAEDDYQGSAAVMALASDGSIRWASWSYGSCSGCDAWEELDDAKRTEEAAGCTEAIARGDLNTWLAKREETGYRGETDSIRAALAQAGLS